MNYSQVLDARRQAQETITNADCVARHAASLIKGRLRSTTNWASNSSNERIDVRNSPELWDAAVDAAIQKELTP